MKWSLYSIFFFFSLIFSYFLGTINSVVHFTLICPYFLVLFRSSLFLFGAGPPSSLFIFRPSFVLASPQSAHQTPNTLPDLLFSRKHSNGKTSGYQ
jgi:hypothetical protein